MSKPNDPNSAQLLDRETLELLGSEMQPVELPPDRMDKLRARIMDRLDAETAPEPIRFATVRSDGGHWEEIAPRIHKKVLHFDPDTGVETYLLRAEAGAEAPPHDHDHDEHCLVLEGDVAFENVQLKAGDYHFAPKGSQHSAARTRTGALLFMQTAAAA